MTKRRLKKLIKRAVHLPTGFDLVRYTVNKIYSFYLSRTGSLKVAHPSTIMIEVTNFCNLRCVICPRESDSGKEMDKGYMDFTKLRTIVDQAYPYVDSIGLTGLGETFLYEDIIPVVKYIKNKSKGIIISCSINAHLKNSVEIAEKLMGVIDTIQISMDGLHDVYEKIRVGGNFDFFSENVYKISKLSLGTDTHIMLNVVLVKENYHQMAEMVEFAGKSRIHYLNMRPVSFAAEEKVEKDYGNTFFSEDFNKHLEKAINKSKQFKDLELTFGELGHTRGFKTCKYPWNYFYVTWDGYIPICCGIPFPKNLNFGNVFEDGLMAGLNSQKFQDIRKMWFDNKTPETCVNCSKII